jgi:hypothetical protein
MTIQANFPAIKPSLLLDFANTKQLDSRITYTRASTATFYNGVTTAKAEENLVLYSQDFDNVYWNKNNCNITPNTTTAPDGTSTADSLIENTANTIHYLSAPIGGGVIGQVYTVSIYAKANTRTIILLYTAMNGGGGTYFDLSAGTIGTTNGVAPTSSAISSVGSGWYRCSITYTATITSGVNAFQCFLVQSGTTVSYTGDGTSGVFVWGAQLEQRSAVSAYTATTTQAITNYIPALQTAASGVARFDNNLTTGESLGLLIEESRSNLNTYSDDLANAAWTKVASSITSNTIVAPDGTLTGDKLVEDSANAAHYVTSNAPSVTSGTAYTLSVYAKAGERSVLQIVPSASGFPVSFANFNLATGAIGTLSGLTSTSITLVGNGWYRCSVTVTASATTTASVNFIVQTSSSASRVGTYQGDGFSGIFLWGAQFEAGSFATSYIPTVASQVTRAADAASMTGTNFSTWYRADEGAAFVDIVLPSTAPVDCYPFRITGASALVFGYKDSGTLVRPITGTVSGNGVSTTASYKASGAYSFTANEKNGAVNGTLAGVTTTGAFGLNTAVEIGGFNSSAGKLNGCIKKIAYYPLRVTNAQLQALTS